MATSSPPTVESQHEHDTPQLPPRPEETPTLTTAQTAPTAAADTEIQEINNLPPEVAALKDIFPDFDPVVLQGVLETVDNNQERAIDILLSMSDPSYVPPHQPEEPSSHPIIAGEMDTSQDEALARQLALDDEEDRRRGRRQATGQSWPRRGAGVPAGVDETLGLDQRQGIRNEVPYEVRTSGTAQGQQQAQSGYVTGSERGDFQDFQETVSRIAESGKRTFSSVIEKIKAKINEYEQSGSPGSGSSNQQQQQGPPPSGQSRVPNPIYANSPSASSASPPPVSPPSGVNRHAASQAFAPMATPTATVTEYNADWEHTTAGWKGDTVGAGAGTAAGASVNANPVKGYDVGGETPSLAQPSQPRPQTPSSPPPVVSPSPRGSTDIPRPPATQSGSPINAAKLGLLPKRPVSLLRSQPPSETKPAKEHDGDDDDDLEYIENPFEEGKAR
ncbi:unnamed protein product [Somion occarium]|uniref:CUE domain-containing protein n=1 Tax=Somion occarium TaxID=3059160 RepID=A0ABP1DEA9_9APHY